MTRRPALEHRAGKRAGERAGDRDPVVIAGGGPAGAVAALVLARRGVPVTVLERRTGPAAKVGETLPPTAAPLLAHLGLDDLLAADGHLRSHGNRAVWGAPEPYDAPFLANPHGAGWHVDRQRLEARLAATARAAGAEWRWGCEVVGCERNGEGWRLTVRATGGEGQQRAGPRVARRDEPGGEDRSGEGRGGEGRGGEGRGGEGRGGEDGGGQRGAVEMLAARYLADATGRAARLARRLGARRVRHDRLVGVAALLAPSTALRDTYTLVESTPDGWWYSALLTDGRLAVAWMTDGDLLHRDLRGGDPEPWWRLLRSTAATRERVEAHGGRVLGALRRLPAETSHLDAVAGEGWLAVGDAAAAYDPLSSQGIGSAMGGGLYAGHAIADHLAGREEAIPAYLHLLETSYGRCLDLQRAHYARETRWPEAPFWRRRQAREDAGDCSAGAAGASFAVPSTSQGAAGGPRERVR